MSKVGKVFGGYTLASWSGSYLKKDDTALIFSLDKRQIYRPLNSQKAIYCASNWGPCFGGYALGLQGNLLNNEDAGYCFTNGQAESKDVFFNIQSDSEGNHEVTGEGKKQYDDLKKFTCVELEVYGITF